ncbi:uncharacterized protein VTP21DRAFT_4930 [Calcarisporiella thermophila]|uniref:uncharacterized protein n=1 Tax=Calcarisporiella thermophila TaxID=911321 RepID=UPI003742B2BC
MTRSAKKRTIHQNVPNRSYSSPNLQAQCTHVLPPAIPSQKKTPLYHHPHTRHLSQNEPNTTWLWGYALLITTFVMFVVGMYAVVVSKFMPVTGNKILDAIKEDVYYSALVPLTLPVTVWAVLWNWLGMKYFRHN